METFTIVGFKKRIDPSLEGQDIMNLWKQLWSHPNTVEFIKKNIMPVAVYFEYEGDQTKPYSLIVGFKSEKKIEEFEFLEVPVLQFQEFEKKGTMPQVVFECWQDVWDSNIKRAFLYDIEEYLSKDKVKLHISIL